MGRDFLNQSLKLKKEVLKKDFIHTKPFSHLVLPDFFNGVEEIKIAVEQEEMVREESDLFSFEQTKRLEECSSPILKELYNWLNSEEVKQLIKELTGIEVKGKAEVSGYRYREYDYLLPHDDELAVRKIAFVINLSTLIKEEGGQLEFFNGNNVVKQILPKKNMFILFEVSKRSIHQVAEVGKERLTISGWFTQ